MYGGKMVHYREPVDVAPNSGMALDLMALTPKLIMNYKYQALPVNGFPQAVPRPPWHHD